jgi:hypothetical protein
LDGATMPPEEDPRIARASLNGHTMLFLSGKKVELVGVPYQWLRAENPQGPLIRNHKNTATPNNTATTGRNTAPRWAPRKEAGHPVGNRGEKPKAKKAGTGRTNNNFPPVFAQSTEISDLVQKHPHVQLWAVAHTARLYSHIAVLVSLSASLLM